MNNIVNTIASSVLSKNINDCTLQELQQLAETHPYAGAIQLLYAQKLKENNSDAFAPQWQKTLLYFNNPLFVQHVVNASPEATQSIKQPGPFDALNAEDTENITNEDGQQKTSEEVPGNVEADVPPIPGLKIEPIDPEKAALSFTPYHTIDYFASQGIKLSDDIKAADRFGNQLKSFTSWLKEMRRLPEAEVVSKFSRFENNKIEKMAENSLTGENAITESMAQVWVKQGNPRKAIDIYQKLSLQNPAKSAFFAAKIEHLKKQL